MPSGMVPNICGYFEAITVVFFKRFQPLHQKTINSCMSFCHLTKAYWGEVVGVIDLFPRSPVITTPEGFCFWRDESRQGFSLTRNATPHLE
jgi:hypothetical protein